MSNDINRLTSLVREHQKEASGRPARADLESTLSQLDASHRELALLLQKEREKTARLTASLANMADRVAEMERGLDDRLGKVRVYLSNFSC